MILRELFLEEQYTLLALVALSIVWFGKYFINPKTNNNLIFFKEDLSVLSEDVASLMSPDERFDSPGTNDWLPQNPTDNTTSAVAEYGQELISKGPPKAEVQLR